MTKRKADKAFDDIFTPTEQQPEDAQAARARGEIPKYGKIQSMGVGLRESEIDLLDEIAQEAGEAASRNMLMRHAVRELLKRYLAGGLESLELPIKREVVEKIEWE